MLRLVKGTAAGMKTHAEKQVCQQGKGGYPSGTLVRGSARVHSCKEKWMLQTLCLCSTSLLTSAPAHQDDEGCFKRRKYIQVIISCYKWFPKI